MEEAVTSPVLVTGFGPFHHHSVNASWAAVQELEKMSVVDSDSESVPLVTREVSNLVLRFLWKPPSHRRAGAVGLAGNCPYEHLSVSTTH